MSANTSVTIWCDCTFCHNWTGGEGSKVMEARRAARAEGWQCSPSMDICPTCKRREHGCTATHHAGEDLPR